MCCYNDICLESLARDVAATSGDPLDVVEVWGAASDGTTNATSVCGLWLIGGSFNGVARRRDREIAVAQCQLGQMAGVEEEKRAAE